MNSHKLYRIKGTVCDLLLAVMILAFTLSVAMSATVGNVGFYSHFLDDKQITAELKTALDSETEAIAQKTGIEQKAFEFAVGQNKISNVQKEIVKSAFSGSDYNYTDSAKIKSCYRDGITEFYRYNGMELDEDALEDAVPLACKAFNKVMGIQNNIEFANFAHFLSRTSVFIAVASLIFVLALCLRVFTHSGGRTKMHSHYACAFLSAGYTLVLLFVLNIVTGYSSKLYLTNNKALNIALSGGFNAYFFIEACFGAAFIIAGISMMIYVGRYYRHKAAKIKQEQEINSGVYVASQYGDVTIGDIAKGSNKEITDEEQEIHK